MLFNILHNNDTVWRQFLDKKEKKKKHSNYPDLCVFSQFDENKKNADGSNRCSYGGVFFKP